MICQINWMNDEYLVKAGMSRSIEIIASLSKISKNPNLGLTNHQQEEVFCKRQNHRHDNP